MGRNIFLDLDGTLIDVRQRLYSLFMELVPHASFTFDEYWRIKRERTDQNALLSHWFHYTPEQIRFFKESWMEKVEEEDRLALDKPFEKIEGFLNNISQNHDLYLVTARQKPDLVQRQIAQFGWTSFFKEILVTRQALGKAEIIKHILIPQTTDIFVGDTGEDVATAKQLDIISVAVCSGFLGHEILKEYQPDYLIEKLTDLHETGLLSS